MARTCPGRGSLLHLPACAPLLRPTEGVLIRDTWPLRNLPPPRVLMWGLDKGEGACERSPHAVGARQSGPPLNELKMLGPQKKGGGGLLSGPPGGRSGSKQPLATAVVELRMQACWPANARLVPEMGGGGGARKERMATPSNCERGPRGLQACPGPLVLKPKDTKTPIYRFPALNPSLPAPQTPTMKDPQGPATPN
ncbi:hypothetical protein NDU88_001710 [Pleurodeles waltl]|uniref:Uncharacterized protein n=1 Tax=Pleurodeles waltl TaxID=8319 RepID=A0AAV7Q4U1_PLEWA|nr:hypothetical protein NDU88_001710 [Pleurodeles waltl]